SRPAKPGQEPLEETRRQQPSEGLVSSAPPREDGAIALLELRPELRDRLRRILQIRVEDDGPPTTREGQAGQDGAVLSRIPGERHDGRARIRARNGPQY